MVLFVVVACTSKKTTPTQSPTQTIETPKTEEITDPVLLAGKAINEDNCSMCHQSYDPKEYTHAEWEKWLSIMVPKAKLTDEQKANIEAYIYHFCKDK